MSKLLSDLDPKFRPLADRLLSDCLGAGVSLAIIETLRTHEKHLQDLQNGVSWVQHSKHEDGLAIDVCPTDYLSIKGWNPSGPEWQIIGKVGKKLGMRWGGDWKQEDLGHFEYISGKE